MKPFDLQKALAGEKVITRDGREVTQLVKFDAVNSESVYGVVQGVIRTWTNAGKYFGGITSDTDLFMAPKETTYWVNVYRSERHGLAVGSILFISEGEARERRSDPDYIKTISFSVEE